MAGEDEELYSDDELDELQAEELEDAERTAVSLTQFPKAALPSSEYGPFDLDSDEQVFELVDDVHPSPTVQDSTRVIEATGVAAKTKVPWQPSRIVQTHARVTQLPRTQTAPVSRLTNTIIKPEPSEVTTLHSITESDDVFMHDVETGKVEVANLREQNEQLLKELERIRFKLQKAEATAQAKSGEIAIVRSNLDRTVKENERRNIHFQQIQAADEIKHKVALEELRSERDSVLTQIKFLKQENTLDAQTRRRQKSLGNLASPDVEKSTATIFRSRSSPSPFSTPKKSKPLALRDGFEDEEITYVSPTKAHADRRKASFTKAGDIKKRKRGDESPIPLQLSRKLSKETSVGSVYEEELNEMIGAQEERESKQFSTMLNHRIDEDHARTIEELARYHFPGEPKVSLASVILDKLPALQTETKSFPARFCEAVIELCEQCLTEKYYDPLNLLLDLTVFAAFTPPSCIEEVMAEVVRTIQLTADVNLIAAQKSDNDMFSKHLDVSFCLELLIQIATNCLTGIGDIHRFWKTIRIDLLLMCFSPFHELDVIKTTLKLLNTSVLKSGFGPVDLEYPKSRNEDFLIEKLSMLLTSYRDLSSGNFDLQLMRLDIIGFFAIICFTESGSEALARHPKAIGRMFCLISEEIDNLYNGRRQSGKSAQLINNTIRVLQFLNLNHEINFQTKLSSFPGGSHKYLVALTRLTFRQAELLESGIDEEVTECAQDILERIISPEEGDSLYEVFGPKRLPET